VIRVVMLPYLDSGRVTESFFGSVVGSQADIADLFLVLLVIVTKFQVERSRPSARGQWSS
jgi:hypothetical protein